MNSSIRTLPEVALNRTVLFRVPLWCQLRLRAVIVLLLLLPWQATVAAQPSLHELLLKQGYSAVSLNRSGTGHFEIFAMVNGHKVRLVLDTGAPTCVIDRARGRRLGLNIRRQSVSARGIGDADVTAELAEMGTIQFGDVKLEKVPAAVVDLSVMNEGVAAGEEADGILGADVLTRTKAIIDLARMRLYVRPGR